MIYEIPVYYRSTNLGSGENRMFATKSTIMHVDEVGLFVSYNNKSQLTTQNIRRYLTCRQTTKVYIHANNPRAALFNFFSYHIETRIGGNDPESKAMWIDKNGRIIEMPSCERLYEDKYGNMMCRSPWDDDHESSCVLDGWADGWEGCVISDFEKELHKPPPKTYIGSRYAILLGKKPVPMVLTPPGFIMQEIGGYNFLRKESLIPEEDEDSPQLSIELGGVNVAV